MTADTGPIRSVLVAGAGLVGLSAALAFARALPQATVGIVATPADPAALADRLPAALPATVPLFDLIGLDEHALVQAGAATHRLGDRFTGWRADGASWIHGFGDVGAPIAGGAFHQAWLAARRGAARPPFHRFAPGVALAEAGRFTHPDPDPRSLLSRFDYALRLDADAATRLLAERTAAQGVQRIDSAVTAVARDGAAVRALRLSNGRDIAADLYIDCSGPDAAIASGGAGGGAGEGEWEDWLDALPVDRLLLSTAPFAGPALLDDYKAVADGWRATWPLRDRALVGLGYASAVTGDARARRVLGAGDAPVETIAIRPGRRRAAWRGNVLALGDAAVQAGPLGWPGLALAQADLALALDLLPMRDLHPLVLAEYNRRVAARADRVRDFLALHYRAPGARGAFWQALRGRTPPASLADILAIFARRGHLPRHDEEGYDRQSWLSVLIGLDLVPAGGDPTAPVVDPAEVEASLAALAGAVAALPDRLPPYADYLARMAR